MLSRSGCVVLAVIAGLAGATRAEAHGIPPSAVSIASKDGTGLVVVRLTAGLALHEHGQAFRFLCPIRWGDPDSALPAYGLPNGPVFILSTSGIYLLNQDGSVVKHPDPAAASPAYDIVELAGKLYVLRSRDAASTEIVEVTSDRVRSVWSDGALWTTLTSGDDFLAVARLGDDDQLYQTRLSPDGSVLDSAHGAAPANALSVQAHGLANELYLVVASNGAHQLGRLGANGFAGEQSASAAIAGPIETSDGARMLAIDSALERMDGAMLTPLESAKPINYLGRYRDEAYACTREGLQPLTGAGLGELSLDLTQLLPPDMSGLSAELADQCDVQWQHVRFDLLSLGITVNDPPPAGSAGSAGAGAAAVGGGGAGGLDAMLAGAAGAAGAAQAGQAAPSGAANALTTGPAGGCGCTIGAHARSTRTPAASSLGLLSLCYALRRRQRRARGAA